MNVPIGKITIGLLVIAVIVFGIGLLLEQGNTPSPPTPSPKIPSSPSTPASTPTPSPSPSLPPSPKYNWEVVDLSYKITEKGETWWKFSWQATVKNNTTSVVEFYIDVHFVDKDGFIVDDDIINPSAFSPKEQRLVKGYALVDIDIAPDILGIELGDVDAYTQD